MLYQIVDVREGAELSFCVVVAGAEHEDKVYVFENLEMHMPDAGSDIEVGVNMSIISKTGATRDEISMTDADRNFMQELLTCLVTDFMADKFQDLNTEQHEQEQA